MSQVTIYHNPRCSKSRQTLQILQDHNLEPVVIEYLKAPPSIDDLKSISSALDLPPSKFIRTKEGVFNELKLGDQLEDDQAICEAIVENPILLERPIVLVGDQARIGRPPESVLEILP